MRIFVFSLPSALTTSSDDVKIRWSNDDIQQIEGTHNIEKINDDVSVLPSLPLSCHKTKKRQGILIFGSSRSFALIISGDSEYECGFAVPLEDSYVLCSSSNIAAAAAGVWGKKNGYLHFLRAIWNSGGEIASTSTSSASSSSSPLPVSLILDALASANSPSPVSSILDSVRDHRALTSALLLIQPSPQLIIESWIEFIEELFAHSVSNFQKVEQVVQLWIFLTHAVLLVAKSQHKSATAAASNSENESSSGAAASSEQQPKPKNIPLDSFVHDSLRLFLDRIVLPFKLLMNTLPPLLHYIYHPPTPPSPLLAPCIHVLKVPMFELLKEDGAFLQFVEAHPEFSSSPLLPERLENDETASSSSSSVSSRKEKKKIVGGRREENKDAMLEANGIGDVEGEECPINDGALFMKPVWKGWAIPGPSVPTGVAGTLGADIPNGLTFDSISGHYRVYQYRNGHRFSTDDLLVAWYGTSYCNSVRRALDLGSGIGSVGMIAAWRLPLAQFVTVEAQAISVKLARRSAKYNGLEHRYDIRQGDFRDPGIVADDELFDLVLGSPPYFPLEDGVLGNHEQKIACRFEVRGTVADYCLTAAKHLLPSGVFACVFPVHPKRQEERVIEAAAHAKMTILRRRDVVFKEGEPPLLGLFLMTMTKDLPEAFQSLSWVEPPLIIRKADGSIHPEYSVIKMSVGFGP